MKMIIIGPPGSGKGTQAQVIEHTLGITQISTGDLLRAECQQPTPQAKAIKETIAKGKLIDDDIVLSLLAKRLTQPDCQSGYLLDGFPRTVEQAQALHQAGIHIDTIVVLNVPDACIIERLSGRRIHPASGRSYHLVYNPPKRSGVDDITGEPLEQRSDDNPDTVVKRLAVYQHITSQVLSYYQQSVFSRQTKLIQIEVQDWMLKEDVSALIFEQLSPASETSLPA